MNLKTLFEDPPQEIVIDIKFLQKLPDKYWSAEKDVDTTVLIRAFTNFVDTNAVAYAAWFN